MPQCEAKRYWGDMTYYCLREEGHSGLHENDEVPVLAYQKWVGMEAGAPGERPTSEIKADRDG